MGQGLGVGWPMFAVDRDGKSGACIKKNGKIRRKWTEERRLDDSVVWFCCFCDT